MTGEGLPDLAALAAAEDPAGLRLWRSLEELADAPNIRAYLEAEFPDEFRAAAIDRRALMRLMSASLALAGVGACGASPPSGAPLLSRARNTPGYTPGVPLTFATSLELDGVGRGVLVKAQEGRPIKIEGNPLHPASLGATDVFAQAEILSLYDPDRSRTPTENGAARSWQDVEQIMRPLRNEFVVDEGKGLHVLVLPLASPTLERMMQSAGSAFPNAVWHRYAPLHDDRAQAGAAIAFGRPLDAVYDLTQADADPDARRRPLERSGGPRALCRRSRRAAAGARPSSAAAVLRGKHAEPDGRARRQASCPSAQRHRKLRPRRRGRHRGRERHGRCRPRRRRAARGRGAGAGHRRPGAAGCRARPGTPHQRPSRGDRHDGAPDRAGDRPHSRGAIDRRLGRGHRRRAGEGAPHPRRQSGL